MSYDPTALAIPYPTPSLLRSPHRCPTCYHPRRREIDSCVLKFTPDAEVADRFSLPRTDVAHHRRHLEFYIAKEAEIRERTTAVAQLSELLSVYDDICASRAEADSTKEQILCDTARLRCLELLGRSTGTLKTEAPTNHTSNTLNLTISQEKADLLIEDVMMTRSKRPPSPSQIDISPDPQEPKE